MALFLDPNGKRSAPRLAVWAFSAGLLFWFFLPLPVYGVLNIGNLCGMALCFAICFAALRFPWLSRAVRRFWKRLGGRFALCAVGALLSAGVLLTGVLGARMAAAAAKKPGGGETAIVLGCQVIGTRPSLMLSRRIAAARTFLEENPASACILSGAQGPDEGISEARCMYNELIAAGIDPARLYLEEQSSSTAENIAFSTQILSENGLRADVAIVSDGFHQFRAQKLVAKTASSVCAVNAKTPIILIPTYIAREMVSIVYHWVFG